AKQVYDLLHGCGLQAAHVISILGCQCGRDKGSRGTRDDCPGEMRVSHSCNSFASKFCELLGPGVCDQVFARVCNVRGYDKGSGCDVGQKGTSTSPTKDEDLFNDGNTVAHGRADSQLRFYWVGGELKREWAYEGDEVPIGRGQAPAPNARGQSSKCCTIM